MSTSTLPRIPSHAELTTILANVSASPAAQSDAAFDAEFASGHNPQLDQQWPQPVNVAGRDVQTAREFYGLVKPPIHAQYVAYLRNVIGLVDEEIGADPAEVYGDGGDDFRMWVEDNAITEPYHADSVVPIGRLSDDDYARLVVETDDAAITSLRSTSAAYLEIGRRHLILARAHRDRLKVHTAAHYRSTVSAARERWQLRLTLAPASINLQRWVEAYAMSECLPGDVSSKLGVGDYAFTSSRALVFDAAKLTYSVKPEWVEFFASVASDRAEQADSVPTESFRERADAWEKAVLASAVADGSASADDVADAKDKLDRKAKSAARTARNSLVKAMSAMLEKGQVDPAGLVSLVEDACREHKLSLPPSIGFDPLKSTIEDCRLMAQTMFAPNRISECRAIVNVLAPKIEAVDRAVAASVARNEVNAA